MGITNIFEQMKHIAAYCLLVLGGNNAPTADDVSKLLKDCGATADAENLKTFIAAVGDKACKELIAEGSKKMQSGGCGGAAAAAGGAAAAGAPAAEAEKPKEEEPEEEVDMGGLFGGGDDDY